MAVQDQGHINDEQNKNISKDGSSKNLRDLLVNELKSIYWVEKELTKAIPKMAENATSQELKSSLLKHLAQTKEHATRLEKVFMQFDQQAEAKRCEAIAGLIKDTEETMTKAKKGAVLDAAIIIAGQKTEHFEIAAYGSLISLADVLTESEAEALLSETLEEEKAADEHLTNISKSVNVEADTEGP
jgi:ferritin-like metal-binding protein YciE